MNQVFIVRFKLCLVLALLIVIAANNRALIGANALSKTQEPKPATQQPPAQQEEKLAEQVYKNIQIMKGMPASRLMPGMQRLTQFLGVDCLHCHVPNEFDKDDKPAKQTARKMFEMVRTINTMLKTNRVTCYTCHRGQPQPASMPPAPSTAPKPESSAPEIKPADSSANIERILDNYVQALGGRAVLEKVTTRVMIGNLVTQGGMSAPLEVLEKAPNKTFTTFRTPNGVTLMGFNGAIGWTQSPEGGLREAGGVELGLRRFESEFYKELKIKERYPRMKLLGVAKLGDRNAYVVEAATVEGNAETWYFDEQTHLLVRVDKTFDQPEKKVTLNTFLEDYREVSGIKLPFVIRRSRPDFTWTYKFDEIKLNVPVDESKFNKP